MDLRDCYALEDFFLKVLLIMKNEAMVSSFIIQIIKVPMTQITLLFLKKKCKIYLKF